MGTHVCIAFIGKYNIFTCFGNSEIYTCQCSPSCKKYIAQMATRNPCQQCRIGQSLFRSKMFMKQLSYLFLSFMNTGKYYMTGWFVVDLLYVFTKVRIDYFDSAFVKVLIQMAFFSKHRLTFYQLFDFFRF